MPGRRMNTTVIKEVLDNPDEFRTCPKKQRTPAQTENERGENGENRVVGEKFWKDVRTAETL